MADLQDGGTGRPRPDAQRTVDRSAEVIEQAARMRQAALEHQCWIWELKARIEQMRARTDQREAEYDRWASRYRDLDGG